MTLKRLYPLIVLYLSLGFCTANAINVSITATAGSGGNSLLDGSGSNSSGQLAMLWIDTAGDGLQQMGSSGTTYIAGTYHGNDYLVSTSGSTSIFFGTSTAGFSAVSANDAGISQNDQFYITWHDIAAGTSVVGGGVSYGVSTNAAWLLPADGGAFSGPAGSGGAMAFTPIPEPSTYTIIFGVGALTVVIAHKRRLAKK